MGAAILRLSGGLDEAGVARRFVAQQLAGYPAGVCADAVLLTSELVSNVIRHGQVPAHVELTASRPHLRVVVHDSGDVLPPVCGLRQSGDQDTVSVSGRGLMIVTALAHAWGVSTEPGVPGKGVWFELGPAIIRRDA